MKTRHICGPLVAASLLVGAAAAHAQATPSTQADASVAVRVSTLGLGLEASKLVNPNIAVRVGVNSYSYSHSVSYSDVSYGGHLRLNTIEALGDFYPGQHTGFHVSAGLMINNNRLTGTGQASNGTFTLNGNTYNASDVGSLNGRVTFNSVAPYLGLGLGKPSDGGSPLRVLADIGVLFQGKPKLSLNRSGGTATGTLNNQINADLSAEQSQTQHDVNKFNAYPVVSLGLAYHF